MQPVLTSSEMRAYDRYAIEKLKIPSLLLMENAGKGVVERMEGHFGSLSGKIIHIYCGKGNNGGDGFVVARHLLIKGARVTVILTSPPKDLKGDPLSNYKVLTILQLKKSVAFSLSIARFTTVKKLAMLPAPEIVVDALFGTGFNGALQGALATLVNWLNTLSAKRVSVDIPSGVNADNGFAEGTAINADLTVTLGHKKLGLIVGEGRSYTGYVEVVDIGIPARLPLLETSRTHLITLEDVRQMLPVRRFNAHKHSVGKIFVLAGSRGLTGASAMASESAMRAGAGAVILGTPKSVYPILAKKLTEVMVEPLEETPDGSVSFAAMDIIRKHLRWADLAIIGPGLSRNPETQELIRTILKESDKPILLDADGINALADKPEIIKKRNPKELILTPHVGELSRIIKVSSETIENNRVEIARKTAKEFNVTLVLKGAPTVTATHEGDVFINSTGNAGMATAGSGDVLSGIIAGLWGQGMKSTYAAVSGVFLHGKAGDIAKENFGEKSLLALDIQHFIAEAIKQIEK